LYKIEENKKNEAMDQQI
jgi:hypothetical protein